MNGKKCKEMITSFLQNQPDILRFCIDGQPLDLVSSCKGSKFQQYREYREEGFQTPTYLKRVN